MLKLGSLFDGIGGWQLAAVHAGIIPVWSSEIEPFPCEVTRRHFPLTTQLGDITKIDGAEIEPVDIICAGSPCQDLSIAGKREGLDGKRSGLFRTAIDIVRSMRDTAGGRYPRFFVWENVPGAFSSNKGADFRAVLEEITEAEIPIPKSGHYNKSKEWCIDWAPAGVVRSNGCEVAWRVMDAQYWGVPQRRKRIFLVADFTGGCAAEILFKSESVSRNIATGSGKRKGATCNATYSIAAAIVRMRGGCEGGGKGALVSIEKSLTLAANTNDQVLFEPVIVGSDLYNFTITGDIACTLTCNMRSAGTSGPSVLKPKIWDMTHADEVMRLVKDGIVPTLNARMGTGGNQVPLVQEPIPINDKATRYKGGGDTRQNDGAGNGLGIGKSGDPMPTMTVGDRHAVAYCVGNGQLCQTYLQDKVGALNCMHDQQTVMVPYGSAENQNIANTLLAKGNLSYRKDVDNVVVAVDCRNINEGNISGTLQAKGNGGYSLNYINPVRVAYVVRRLTPVECERLQGLPDGYTAGGSDSARYKALGNGMAQPCADFVIQSIADVVSDAYKLEEAEHADNLTMARSKMENS
jgi:DNA (cytosine-5)-methyltransferase 1